MRWFVLLMLFFGAVINFADKSIIGLAAVPIMKEMNLSYAEWGLVGSSYYWLYPITGIFGAAWADRIGAKKVLGFLMLTWAFLQFGVLAIAALPLLVIYRILLGAFEGPFSPVAYNHADKWFPPKQRGFANSIVVAGGTVGAMIAAPLLVSLITLLGWKAAFACLGLASIVWFFLFQFFTKESPVKRYQKVQKKKKAQLEKINVKDFLKLLGSPSALFTTLAYFSTYILVVWFSVWLPIYLVEAIKMSPGEMGYSVAIIGIVSVLIYTGVSMLSDYLFKKNESWQISRIFVVAGAMIAGALLLASITVFQNPLWVVIAMCLAKGLTYAILPIGPTIMINEWPERGALMTSILTSSGNIAGIIAPILTGYIVGLAGANKIAGYNLSIISMAILVLVFGILFAFFVKPSGAKKKALDHDDLSENSNIKYS
ncbi:MFS transporter [Priestia aryabhattai]|uniref:MFS transporter n=1 Tax=Priestia TaxID=2800373 RepID=UPI0003A83BAF|nr:MULTISPECIES: MFS transporter [Priestia]NHH94701.1 Hexuronate transporter [Bacillus sp. MB95]MBY0077702.1 MFS transporter [Priestia aryabhattai]MDT0149308.1 MFS transporter [Priestia aryabhattai]MDT0155042.1 MFS transporter [Priestia aryabhattai]MEB4857220.1 MFS transporter [Priestia megaterium]